MGRGQKRTPEAVDGNPKFVRIKASEVLDVISPAGWEFLEQHWDQMGPHVKAVSKKFRIEEESLAEVVQGKVARKFGTFDSSRPFVSWFKQLAWRAAIDRLREERRNAPEPLEDWMTDGGQNDVVFEQAGKILLKEKIEAALEQIPEEQAQSVRLSFFDEMSRSEIAELLGLPIGTIHTRIRLAYPKLAAILADERDEL